MVLLVLLAPHDFSLLTHGVPTVYLRAYSPFIGVVLVKNLAEQVLVLFGRYYLVLRVQCR